MVVLEKLTSCKGAKVEVHFEDEGDKKTLLVKYSHEELQKKMRDLIDHDGVDTGKDTVIHLLINSQGIGKSMKEADYAEWQAKEKKDWFHEHRPHPLGELLDTILSLTLLVDLFGGRSGFGMPMGIRVMEGFPISFGDEFVGPTEEEMEEIISDPENMNRISAMEKNLNHDCRLCLESTDLCPIRHASFDLEYLYKTLEGFKSSPTE
ncbi:MAG: hypothetical protein WDA13_02690 [Candidatus Shapirobacteria bacterium]